MNDLISRNAVIELLHTYHIDNIAVNGKRITELIKEISPVELVCEDWIPCSERLPETNGVYSITRKISDGEYRWYISDSAYFDGQNTWHSDNRVNHDREYLKDVIAWQPLPAPYDMQKKVE